MAFDGPLTITTPSDTQVVITRQFDAPRHLVFACYTQPALIKRWLNGAEGWIMTVCELTPPGQPIFSAVNQPCLQIW